MTISAVSGKHMTLLSHFVSSSVSSLQRVQRQSFHSVRQFGTLKTMRVAILGAGIAGTTTALELKRQSANIDVTLIADKFYEDTLSNGAAGIFRPGSGFRSENAGEEKKWLTTSYNFYNDILSSPEADLAGVMSVSGYIFSKEFESITRNPLLEKLLPIYRKVEKEEIEQVCPKNGFNHGAFFETMVIECGDFLPYAIEKFKQLGGKTLRQKVSSLAELTSSYDAVVNCSGLGAKWLCNDDRVVPIRGQVLKVKANWVKMFYYGDFDTYIIPGKRTVTLGGCRNFDSFNEEVDRHDSNSIFERCSKLLPNLGGCEVVKEWVGLRPYRDRVRVEVDPVNERLFHNYGHGGYGITGAPGTAKEIVAKLLQSHLMTAHRSKL